MKKNDSNFWQFHVDQFKKSNISQTDYCAQHGINSKTFGNQKIRRMKEKQLFIPVPIADHAVTKPGTNFAIKINNDIELAFKNIPSPEWFAHFIRSIHA